MRWKVNGRLIPNDRPQYRTTIDFRSRLSTIILGTVQNAMEKHLKQIDEIIDGRMLLSDY